MVNFIYPPTPTPYQNHPKELKKKTPDAKANVYFDGKVVSHTILLASGEKKTVGLIYAGTYHFGTDKAEIMEITDGSCVVVQDGSKEEKTYGAGTKFDVPAKSGFTITVQSGICQYICSFIG